jgi:hypothetical protein
MDNEKHPKELLKLIIRVISDPDKLNISHRGEMYDVNATKYIMVLLLFDLRAKISTYDPNEFSG